MASFVEARRKSAIASAAIGKALRVMFDGSGEMTLAGATDQDLGTNDYEVFAQGDEMAVNLRSAQGTEKVVVDGAVSAGDRLYTAAAGKVTGTAGVGSFIRAIAWEDAGADGDIIEAVPLSGESTA